MDTYVGATVGELSREKRREFERTTGYILSKSECAVCKTPLFVTTEIRDKFPQAVAMCEPCSLVNLEEAYKDGRSTAIVVNLIDNPS